MEQIPDRIEIVRDETPIELVFSVEAFPLPSILIKHNGEKLNNDKVLKN